MGESVVKPAELAGLDRVGAKFSPIGDFPLCESRCSSSAAINAQALPLFGESTDCCDAGCEMERPQRETEPERTAANSSFNLALFS